MKKNQQSSFKSWLIIKYLPSIRSSSEKGYILVSAIGIILSVTGLMLLYGKTNVAEKSTTVATADSNSGFYLAEAALNVRANQLRQTFLDFNRPSGTSPSSADACFDGNPSSNGTDDFACDVFRNDGIANLRESEFSATSYVVERDNGAPVFGQVPAGDNFAGLNMVEYGYSISALAFKNSNIDSAQGKQPNAVLQMDVKSRSIPMFQFTAFYTNNLEILPGEDMLLSGPIHTNGNLYLGANNGTLNINGQITAAKDLYNYKPSDNSTYPDDVVKIANLAGVPINLLSNASGGTTQTTAQWTLNALLQLGEQKFQLIQTNLFLFPSLVY